MKYKIGDKFIDNIDGTLIEIIGYTVGNEDSIYGYEVCWNSMFLEHGTKEIYLDNVCSKIK